MKSKVLEIINEYKLIKQGEKVTVALSGGADSVALLYVLLELGYNVSALHINHGVRGVLADSDEKFCKELCEKLNVPFRVEHLSLTKASEDEMRQLRYEIFKGEHLVATAHHIEDNTETVLINLIRGTGKLGLSGIPIKNKNIIRPLLTITRQEIEEYLREKNQSYCTDLTNFDNEIVRNNLRNNIIPQLRKINQNLDKNIFNTCRILSQDEEKSSKIAELKLEFKNLAIEYDYDKLNSCYDLLKAQNGSLQLSRDYCFNVVDGKYNFSRTHDSEELKEIENISILPGRISLSTGKTIVFTQLSEDEIKKFTNSTLKEYKNCVDYDKISGTLSIRAKKNGEHFKMLRRPNKSLKDIYNEEHIPPYVRKSIPIITEYDKPIWVCGLGVTPRVSISKDTKNAIHISLKEE